MCFVNVLAFPFISTDGIEGNTGFVGKLLLGQSAMLSCCFQLALALFKVSVEDFVAFFDVRFVKRPVKSEKLILRNRVENTLECATGVPLVMGQHPSYPINRASFVAFDKVCIVGFAGSLFHDL